MKNFVLRAYADFTTAKLIAFARGVLQKLDKNPFFPDAANYTGELLTATDALEAQAAKAVQGTPADRLLRDQLYDALVAVLDRVRSYVNFAGDSDRMKLFTSGFELNRVPERNVLGASLPPQVFNSNQNGELIVHIIKTPGAESYIVQYSTDPNAADDGWVSVPSSRLRMKLTGLQPGTEYYIRVVAVGTRSQMSVSDVVSRIAA